MSVPTYTLPCRLYQPPPNRPPSWGALETGGWGLDGANDGRYRARVDPLVAE